MDWGVIQYHRQIDEVGVLVLVGRLRADTCRVVQREQEGILCGIFLRFFDIATARGDRILGRERFYAIRQVLECVLSLDDISGDIAHVNNVEVYFGEVRKIQAAFFNESVGSIVDIR